jgi:hypothetical protein
MSMSAPVCTTSLTGASLLGIIFGAIRRFMIRRVAAIMSRVKSFSSSPMARA